MNSKKSSKDLYSDESSSNVATESGSNDGETTIFIKGIDFDITENVLKEEFSKFGKIVRVEIPLTPNESRNKGFGYVEYEHINSFKKALEMNGKEFYGRKIMVEKAITRTTGVKMFWTVFVKNLPYGAKSEDLEEYFGRFGKLYNVSVPFDTENENRNKGFAFVEFYEEKVANKVVKMKQLNKNKRPLFVSLGNKNESRCKNRIRSKMASIEKSKDFVKDDSTRNNFRRDDSTRNNSKPSLRGNSSNKISFNDGPKKDARVKKSNKILFDDDSEN